MTGLDDPFTQPSAVTSVPPIVTASFESECTECLGWIDEGDEIQADGSGGWRHAECLPLLLVTVDRERNQRKRDVEVKANLKSLLGDHESWSNRD